MPQTPPVIGAALTATELANFQSWILEKDRDLELQGFHTAALPDGDWHPVAARARMLLGGYGGRPGIHGPFWGFALKSSDPLVQEVVRKGLEQGLDVCGVIGATQMVVHSPFTAWDDRNLDQAAGQREQVFINTHDVLVQIVRRAE